MTYTAIKPPLSALNVDETPLVTIEFAPNIHPTETEEYNYQPKFVFGDEVINKFNPSKTFTICGMELIESKTLSGRLLNQPYWKYKVDDGNWYEESVLIRQSDTCAKCPYFQDYNDKRGCGWCHLFDDATRKHHVRTLDCDLNSSSLKALLYSEFDYGDLVKIIDPDQDHSEWGTLTVVDKKHNSGFHRSIDHYLTESEWYYMLSPSWNGKEWIAENELCHAEQAHLVETKELF